MRGTHHFLFSKQSVIKLLYLEATVILPAAAACLSREFMIDGRADARTLRREVKRR
jgi:hypothetical protein